MNRDSGTDSANGSGDLLGISFMVTSLPLRLRVAESSRPECNSDKQQAKSDNPTNYAEW